jgi:leucyl/phenylalanyl-tRNA--protein transferase
VESWQDGELVGGLYGVSLGRVFFGESMFARAPTPPRSPWCGWSSACAPRTDRVIDCQQATGHLASLGAREIPRAAFAQLLRESIQYPPSGERWTPGD